MTNPTTWHVAYRARRCVTLYRLMRHKIIWALSPDGKVLVKRRARGRLAALVALVKYLRSPVPF